jgi:hypothetical protein
VNISRGTGPDSDGNQTRARVRHGLTDHGTHRGAAALGTNVTRSVPSCATPAHVTRNRVCRLSDEAAAAIRETLERRIRSLNARPKPHSWLPQHWWRRSRSLSAGGRKLDAARRVSRSGSAAPGRRPGRRQTARLGARSWSRPVAARARGTLRLRIGPPGAPLPFMAFDLTTSAPAGGRRPRSLAPAFVHRGVCTFRSPLPRRARA